MASNLLHIVRCFGEPEMLRIAAASKQGMSAQPMGHSGLVAFLAA
jgi:hypothetical protein